MRLRADRLNRKWRTARRQPVGQLALMPVAWVLLGLAAVAIRLTAFKRVAGLLGRNAGAVSITPHATSRASRRARTIGRSIHMAANNASFRSDCLPQAIVAALLCRLTGTPYALHLGVSLRTPEQSPGLTAHAWVQSGGITVTGGQASGSVYTPVACFVSPRVARDLALPQS